MFKRIISFGALSTKNTFKARYPLRTTMDESCKSDIQLYEFDDLQKALKQKDQVPLNLVDVREDGEIKETGMVPGAIHVPLGQVESALDSSDEEFQRKYNFAKPKQDDPLIFMCKAGRRSYEAAKIAVKKDYSKMCEKIILFSFLLVYGINKIHSSEIRQFGYRDLTAMQETPDKPLHIIDVREKYEVDATGMIPGSIHLPSRQVKEALESTPEEFQHKYNAEKPKPEDNLVFICKSGVRSLQACETALKCGYKNAINYERGWFDWKCKYLKSQPDKGKDYFTSLNYVRTVD
ncbi:uncharacterized protein LOC135835395 [Planococcus citri]|uniref:uncharacterized protein LOC135835395 n=1 Tax=Planococcus citri TaxID=170843 RepID=UPI0031FA31D3